MRIGTLRFKLILCCPAIHRISCSFQISLNIFKESVRSHIHHSQITASHQISCNEPLKAKIHDALSALKPLYRECHYILQGLNAHLLPCNNLIHGSFISALQRCLLLLEYSRFINVFYLFS